LEEQDNQSDAGPENENPADGGTHSDQTKTDNATDGGTQEHQHQTSGAPSPSSGLRAARYAHGRIRSLGSWIVISISNPESFPHYLIAVFTLGLAIFAYKAWDESTRGTKALEDQVKAMQADQRPYIWIINRVSGPQFREFSNGIGQVSWNFQYTNYGRSVAYQFNSRPFIKVGGNIFRPTLGTFEPAPNEPVPSGSGIIPPGKIDFNTAFSPPTIAKDDFSAFLITDNAIGLLVEMRYTDAYSTVYTDAFCLSHLASGATGYRPPSDCKK
jgi:hypothetical protein